MKNPAQDLAEIKSMMERSKRFLSLSGLSGVLAGGYALAAASMAYYWLFFPASPLDRISEISRDTLNHLLWTGIVVLALSVATAYLLSRKKSKKSAEQLWSPAGRQFLTALFVPVLTGGILCFALIHQGIFSMIPAAMLVFYGLGLFAAANHTLSDIRYLGMGQIVLGLLAAFFPAFGLISWTIGFGLLHIVYGSIMYYKYDQ